jgi:hypothetical protein
MAARAVNVDLEAIGCELGERADRQQHIARSAPRPPLLLLTITGGRGEQDAVAVLARFGYRAVTLAGLPLAGRGVE